MRDVVDVAKSEIHESYAYNIITLILLFEIVYDYAYIDMM